ncbi:MAG: acyl-CoA dehydrogenase [Chloroflexota bacterium]
MLTQKISDQQTLDQPTLDQPTLDQLTLDQPTNQLTMAPLVLNEELKLLHDSARRFIQKESPVSELRNLRDSRSETGYSPELWQGMVEMGWIGLTIPEEHDGLGYERLGWAPILEEMGRNLVASPFLSTVVLGATAVQIGGNDAQKAEILPSIASGEKIMALALEEGNHHAPTQINMAAVKTESGYSLSGQKRFVLDGHIADTLIVPVRTSGTSGDTQGITLMLVDGGSPDLSVERTIMVDNRNASVITFNEVEVASSAVLGEVDNGYPLLEKMLDVGRIALAAEMLGVCLETFERTLNYLKTRKQFGVHIGSFQSLQHRASQMFCELELCKSVVLRGLVAIDEEGGDLAMAASLAKYTLGQATQLVTREAIQMYGGIGMTDEEEIGFFLKRAVAAEQTLGGDSYHSDRFASLRGY